MRFLLDDDQRSANWLNSIGWLGRLLKTKASPKAKMGFAGPIFCCLLNPSSKKLKAIFYHLTQLSSLKFNHFKFAIR